MNIEIRRAAPEDFEAISAICFQTGYMGKSLHGHFSDQRLFAEIFALHYPRFERETSLVAVVNGRVAAYCIGTADTIAQRQRFSEKQVSFIKKRLLSHSLWRHPVDAYRVLKWSRKKGVNDDSIVQRFPAHLHMNTHPDYQRQGIGGRLIEPFLGMVRDLGAKGVHLQTSTANLSALNFYQKFGFHEVSRRATNLWDDAQVASVCLAKRFGED